MFYNIHCVDVHFKSDGFVLIRDGSFSMFDQTKALDDLEPIRGFKAFLYKYVDEAALSRRTSQTEDDNPPSPLSMDQDSSGLKFPSHHTPPSNPLTPMSPHGGQSQSNLLQSPPSNRQPSASPAPSPAVFPTVSQTPSRILPQRLWAAAIPTPLTFKAFDELCRPNVLAGSSSSGMVSPLHRFLGW